MAEHNFESIWPGLNSYTEEDQTRFFGRDKEIEQLHDCITAETICTVYGPSGVGKTSLLLAGVFPKLRSHGCLPVYIRLDHSESAKPYAIQVEETFLQAAQNARLLMNETCPPISINRGETLWEWFHRHEFTNLLKNKVMPVLVLDQFEEFFTLGNEKADKEQWFDDLSDLCANCIPEIVTEEMMDSDNEFQFSVEEQSWHVLLCLREDFLPRLEERAIEATIFKKNRFSVSPLSRKQALEVVIKAGKDVLNETVANAIVDYVVGSSGKIETPLLSLFCSQLDILRQKNNLPEITFELVENNKNDILVHFYDETMSLISEHRRDYLESTLLNSNGYRNSLQIDEAIQKGISQDELNILVQKRLLHVITRDNVQWVEFSHDILAPVAQKARERRRNANQQKAQRQKIIGIAELLYSMVGNVDDFVRQYNDNLKIWQDRANANVKALIAMADSKENDFETAWEQRYEIVCHYYEDALKIVQECHLPDNELVQILILYTKWLGEADVKKANQNAYMTAEVIRRLQQKQPGTFMVYSAQSLENLAKLHADSNRLEDAEREYAEALRIYRHLSRSTPEDHESNMATTLNNLGKLHAKLNRHNEAESEYKEALAIRRRLATSNPERYDAEVANTLNNLARLHVDLDRHADAEQEYAEALSIRRRLAEASPARYDSDLADTLNSLALLHASLKRPVEAEREYTEALSIRRRLAESSHARYDSDVAETLNNLAILHVSLKRYTEAAREFAVARSIRRRLLASNPERYEADFANTLYNFGLLHINLNHPEETERECKEALLIYRRLASANPGRYDPDLAMLLYLLAIAHTKLNRLGNAESEYNEALKIYQRLNNSNPGRYDSYIALSMYGLASIHAESRPNEAEHEFTTVLPLLKRLAESNPKTYDSYVAKTFNNLAVLHAGLNRLDDAEREFDETLTIYRRLAESQPEQYSSYVAMTLNNLGTLQLNSNQYEKAEKSYNEAIEILRKLSETQPDSCIPNLLETLENMEGLYQNMNLPEKVNEIRKEIDALREYNNR